LLPWDVLLKVDKEKWPAVSESKKSKGKKGHKGTSTLSIMEIAGWLRCPTRGFPPEPKLFEFEYLHSICSMQMSKERML
jgi:hypothetical protein